MSTPLTVADRYRIDSRLGAGGMSTVFLATDTVLERSVAVKLLAEHLADDEAFVARFRREALAAARLQHPNIVQVFDSGRDTESDRHYIVMEYVDGPSCADMLREQKQLDVEETVRIVRDSCHGLDYAHRMGVVHRDVKPGNLLVAHETGMTKLADFGIAKAAAQTRITQVGSVLGTAAYLSPEQARGDEAGPASDIYSLGVCAYQFLAGRLPHEYGSLTELALRQQEDSVVPIAEYRPDVPPALDAAVRLCLERQPEARYASGLQLAEALEAGLHGESTAVTRALVAGLGPDTDATSVMDATDATRALGRTRVAIPPQPPRTGQRPAQPQPHDAEPQESAERKRWKAFLGLLAVLVVVVGIAIAVLSSTGGGGGGTTVQPVDKGDVQQQIDGIRNFLDEHSK